MIGEKRREMKILFVCRHNVFRSRVAELYFNMVNKNKKNEAKSAGLFPGDINSVGSKPQLKICSTLGFKIIGKAKPITTNLLRWQDLIVIVANDFPKSLFLSKKYKNKVIVWNVKDTKKHPADVKEIDGIIEDIKKKVRGLVEKFK